MTIIVHSSEEALVVQISTVRDVETTSTNRNGWPLIFAMISYDKKMKNQIGYRVSLHDEYDEG